MPFWCLQNGICSSNASLRCSKTIQNFCKCTFTAVLTKPSSMDINGSTLVYQTCQPNRIANRITNDSTHKPAGRTKCRKMTFLWNSGFPQFNCPSGTQHEILSLLRGNIDFLIFFCYFLKFPKIGRPGGRNVEKWRFFEIRNFLNLIALRVLNTKF